MANLLLWMKYWSANLVLPSEMVDSPLIILSFKFPRALGWKSYSLLGWKSYPLLGWKFYPLDWHHNWLFIKVPHKFHCYRYSNFVYIFLLKNADCFEWWCELDKKILHWLSERLASLCMMLARLRTPLKLLNTIVL